MEVKPPRLEAAVRPVLTPIVLETCCWAASTDWEFASLDYPEPSVPPVRFSHCRLLPPRQIAKLLLGKRMVGRGGGDRKDKLLNKACALYALQLPAPANWNKRNKAVN